MSKTSNVPKVIRRVVRSVVLGAAALLLTANCADDSNAPPVTPGTEGSVPEWNPTGPGGACNVDALLSPHSYGAKVKALLTALPLTEPELDLIEADPDNIKGLIDEWMAMPEAEAVLERYFMTAFEQTGGDNESLFYLMGQANTGVGRFTNPNSARMDEMLNANLAESFARTVSVIVKEGRPFSDVITGNEFMMTSAQMAFMAFTDDYNVDDEEDATVRTSNGHFDTVTLVRDQVDAPPPAQALDRNHANFATFWHPDLVNLDVSCNVLTSQQVDTTQNVDGEWRLGRNSSYWVFSAMMLGRVQNVRRHNAACSSASVNIEPLMERSDFTDWRMVTVRRPAGGETPTIFYDMDALRGATEIVAHTERLGFMTSPGFFSTWPNNEDNSSRVTINQTLIVALNASFDGEAVTDFAPDDLDGEHAPPGGECYGCHQTMDPMRDYMRASYTNFYGQQLDPERTALQGDFVFKDVRTAGSGVVDLSQALANHPFFPWAWAQKLCYYANASACPEGDELDRVVQAFADSNLDFRVLVRELFSSPLITGRECVAGVDAGTAPTIARRSQFCANLSHRLGVADICGVRTASADADNLQNDVRDAVASVPDDTFSRAVIEPIVIAETGLFTRANREAACVLAAQQGFDQVFANVTADDVINTLLTGVMGLPPNDPRHDGAKQILQDHVAEVVDGGDTEEVALQSAFALACMAPGSAGVGF